MSHVVCYSGGHSSALVALEVAHRYGKGQTVLVNHDINASVESSDIKRFKAHVSSHIGLPVTFVSYRDAALDQFDVCVEAGAFKVGNGPILCTSRLKTGPFMEWLAREFPAKDCTVYYGFDANEQVRIQRRSSIMSALGYRTDFPLATWPAEQRTVLATEELGIVRPNTYEVFKHGNCVGCLKAGWQHWYIVFCTRPDIWNKAKWAEEEIGHSIHHDDSGPVYLADMEQRFAAMRAAGVEATEHVPHQRFWADAKRVIRIQEDSPRPVACDECSVS